MDDYRANMAQLEEYVVSPVKQGLKREIKKFCIKLGISERELFSECKIVRGECNDSVVISVYYKNSFLKIFDYTDHLRIGVGTYVGGN